MAGTTALARTGPVIRSAASRPEISAVGTPTPGTVPQPASTTLSVPRGMLPGRNGPLCRNECAKEKGVPATRPSRAQSAGVTTRRMVICASRPGSSRLSTREASRSAWAPPVASHSIRPRARLGAGARM